MGTTACIFQCGPDTKMMNIIFKPGSIPPYIDQDYTGCVMCDKNIQEAFNMTIKSSASNTTNTQNNTHNSSNNRQQNNNRNNSNGPGTMNNNNKKSHQKPRTNNVTSSNGAVTNRPGNPGLADAEDNQPVCECGQPAIQLTVRKEGANQGMTASCVLAGS